MSKAGIFKQHDGLWVEKYRPQTVKDYIGSTDFKEKIQRWIKDQSITNLFFHGPAGTGKSSLANLLVKQLDCDFKYINASNESGIDIVRSKITEFCQNSSIYPLKILVLDEADGLTPQAQMALKATSEQYSKNTRFIFTANEFGKIIDPLKSRCQEFNVIPPTKSQVFERCKEILDQEKVDYDEEEVDSIVEFNYPDIRKCIQDLQRNTISNVLKLDKEYFKLMSYQKKIIEILNSAKESNMFDKIKDIRQLLSDSRVKDYTTLYRYLYDKIELYMRTKNNYSGIHLILNDGLWYDSMIADKEINIISVFIKILELITK